MTRLIDADWIWDEVDRTRYNDYGDYNQTLNIIDDAPTIEIVRCNNCKHYWQSAQMCTNAEFPQSGTMMPYDFCSKGKPKEVAE